MKMIGKFKKMMMVKIVRSVPGSLVSNFGKISCCQDFEIK